MVAPVDSYPFETNGGAQTLVVRRQGIFLHCTGRSAIAVFPIQLGYDGQTFEVDARLFATNGAAAGQNVPAALHALSRRPALYVEYRR
jgi:hypothetical protein